MNAKKIEKIKTKFEKLHKKSNEEFNNYYNTKQKIKNRIEFLLSVTEDKKQKQHLYLLQSISNTTTNIKLLNNIKVYLRFIYELNIKKTKLNNKQQQAYKQLKQQLKKQIQQKQQKQKLWQQFLDKKKFNLIQHISGTDYKINDITRKIDNIDKNGNASETLNKFKTIKNNNVKSLKIVNDLKEQILNIINNNK